MKYWRREAALKTMPLIAENRVRTPWREFWRRSAIFNTAFYSNPKVDKDLADALKTTDRAEKARLYKDAQYTIWQDHPWIPLVVEQLVSANSKNLSGFYVMPDTSFNFDEATLK